MVTLTDHQFAAVKEAASWYNDADSLRGEFMQARYTHGYDHASNGQTFTFCGYAGSGKAQPLDCRIMTPDGSVAMGDVSVGTVVLHPTHGTTKVVAIHPQGVKPAYKITFRDGSETRCCLNHLWKVYTQRAGWRVMSLEKILELGVLKSSGDMRFRIPLNAATHSKNTLPLDPYVLGVLLGDGYLHGNTPAITVADTEMDIADRVLAHLPAGVSFSSSTKGRGCIQYRLSAGKGTTARNPVTEALESLGLRVPGKSKLIPEIYITSDLEDRWNLLRGLMDSDGTIGARNRVAFCSNNYQLALDFQRLVRSLGGTSVVRTSIRTRTGKEEYSVSVKVPYNPFYTKRKHEKWSPAKKNPPSRYIKSVEYVGDVFQQCITVDAEDGLYFTDDYIVTHNSTCVGAMIDHIGLNPDKVQFMAPTGKAAKVLTSKLRADGWGNPATTIHKAIYTPKAMQADRIKREIDQVDLHRDWIASKGQIGKEHHDEQIRAMKLDQVDRHLAKLENALREAMDSEGPSFVLKQEDEISPDVELFVVDEASMVGTRLAEDLALFGRPILALGDPGQLPPVGEPWGFNLDDPNVFLTEIHRQATDNPIIQLATMARQGKDLKVGDYGEGVRVIRRRDDNVTLDLDRDAMVLCGTHKTRWKLTKKIRQALGITETGPMADEPLLVCRNSKKHPGLVNGSILRNIGDHGDLQNGNARITLDVIDDDADGLQYQLTCAQPIFEEHVFRQQNSYSAPTKAAYAAKAQCEHLDFGHVLTVHKSQGSEWDDVVVHDESGVFRDQGSRWLYTGITRAAKDLTVVVT